MEDFFLGCLFSNAVCSLKASNFLVCFGPELEGAPILICYLQSNIEYRYMEHFASS